MTKLSNSDFCDKCIDLEAKNVGGGGKSIKELLDSPGYKSDIGPMLLNPAILQCLKEHGGCSGCISTLRSRGAGGFGIS